MSTDSDKQERNRLQHEAEHERPHKRSSVLLYLVILFAAAFLLLLMSYFMQQRANQEAMDKLELTSDSATQSLENILQENRNPQGGKRGPEPAGGPAPGGAGGRRKRLRRRSRPGAVGGALLFEPNSRPIQRRALLRCPGCGGRRRGLWLERAAWRGYWVRWPMGLPASSDRTTTPWRPTSPSWSGWADCFT